MATITPITGDQTLKDSRSIINTNFDNLNTDLTTIIGLSGIPGPTGPTGPTGPMGTGIVYRGAWSNATSYAQYDAVTYNGESYVAILSNTAVTPGTDPSKWAIFAAKGAANASSAYGAQSSRPGTLSDGERYFATDSPFINIYTSGGWVSYYAPLCVPPPPAASWTIINGSLCALTDTAAGLNLTRITGNTTQAGAFIAVPATPYKIAVKIRVAGSSNDANSWAGLYWLDSTSSPDKFTMAISRCNTNFINYNGSSFTSSSPSYHTAVYDPNDKVIGLNGPETHMIFEDNGTNRYIHNSADGVNYVTLSGWPRARNDNAVYGYFGIAGQGSALTTITLASYRTF